MPYLKGKLSYKNTKLFLLFIQILFGFILILSSNLSTDEFGQGMDLKINVFEFLVVGLTDVHRFKYPVKPSCYILRVNVTTFVGRENEQNSILINLGKFVLKFLHAASIESH